MGELVSISTGSPPGSLCSCTAESLPPSTPCAPHGSIVLLLTFLAPHVPHAPHHVSCAPHVPRSPPCTPPHGPHTPLLATRTPPEFHWKKPLQSLRHKSFVGCHTHHPFAFSLQFATLMCSSSFSSHSFSLHRPQSRLWSLISVSVVPHPSSRS